MEDISLIHKIIPGLPATEEEAIAQIEEIENSTDSDWLDFKIPNRRNTRAIISKQKVSLSLRHFEPKHQNGLLC